MLLFWGQMSSVSWESPAFSRLQTEKAPQQHLHDWLLFIFIWFFFLNLQIICAAIVWMFTISIDALFRQPDDGLFVFLYVSIEFTDVLFCFVECHSRPQLGATNPQPEAFSWQTSPGRYLKHARCAPSFARVTTKEHGLLIAQIINITINEYLKSALCVF